MTTTPNRALPDPADEPTVTVERVAAIFGISRSAAYAAVDRGEVPHVRVGRSVRVLSARFLAAYFPESLPTEFDKASDPDALTSGNTGSYHENLTTRGHLRGVA